MQQLNVNQPFSLRLQGATDLVPFTAGVHEVEDTVLEHWFVKACIADGRAQLLPTPAPSPAPPKDVPPKKGDKDKK